MSYLVVLGFCVCAYLILAICDGVRKNRVRVFLVDLIPLVCLVGLWIAIAVTKRSTSFGGGPPVLVIAIMFGCILLGIGGRYLFFLKGTFSWVDFLKPLVISPIVLLPLYGSVSASTELTPMQTVSFALLAYQNGFFWQAVLDRSNPKADLLASAAVPAP